MYDDDTKRLTIKDTYNRAISTIAYSKYFINDKLVDDLDESSKILDEIKSFLNLSDEEFDNFHRSLDSIKQLIVSICEVYFSEEHNLQYFKDKDFQNKAIREVYRTIGCMQSLSSDYIVEMKSLVNCINDEEAADFVMTGFAKLIELSDDAVNSFESEFDHNVRDIVERRNRSISMIELDGGLESVIKSLLDIDIQVIPSNDSIYDEAVKYTAMLVAGTKERPYGVLRDSEREVASYILNFSLDKLSDVFENDDGYEYFVDNILDGFVKKKVRSLVENVSPEKFDESVLSL